MLHRRIATHKVSQPSGCSQELYHTTRERKRHHLTKIHPFCCKQKYPGAYSHGSAREQTISPACTMCLPRICRVDHQVQNEVYFVSICEARSKHSKQNALREKLTILWLQFTSLQALNQESTKRDCFAHTFYNLLNWQRIWKICFAVLTRQQSNFIFCSSWSLVLVIWYFAWSHHIFFLTHTLHSCISFIKLGVWRAFSFKPLSLQVVWQVLYTREHFLKFDGFSSQRHNTKPLN